MLNTSFSPWPVFSRDEQDAALRCLSTGKVNYWTGDEGKTFEKEFAQWCGTRHAVALANGTVALELALKVLGVGAGDEVILTPRSFMASASCVALVGARPVFVDVDPDSQNILPSSVEQALSKHTKAIICVHLAGWPCEMDRLGELASRHGVALIEDCAQAHGARYRGKPVGSLGRLAAWSFCQDKIMTTAGEGGMLTLDEASLWRAAWSFKDHGKSWDRVHASHPPGYRWLHESFGTNWRMTEIQAAIGRIQLRQVQRWHEQRTGNAAVLTQAARTCELLRVPVVPDHIEHAWYKYYVFIRPERMKSDWSRDRIIEEINSRGVPCYSGTCPELYRESAFANTGWTPSERLPVARQLGETCLMFLIHPTLTAAEVSRTANVLSDVSQQALR